MDRNDSGRYVEHILLMITAIMIFLSTVALLVVQYTLMDTHSYQLSLTATGFKYYLNAFGEYRDLYASSIALFAVYYAMRSWREAFIQNHLKIKAKTIEIKTDMLREAIDGLDLRKSDAGMCRLIMRKRLQIIDAYARYNFTISNKAQLTQIFNENFQSEVGLYEQMNNRYCALGEVYSNYEVAYSFNSFLQIFVSLVDSSYDQLQVDLKELYVGSLPEKRWVDEEVYRNAAVFALRNRLY